MIRSSLKASAATLVALVASVALIGWARSHLWGDWLRYYDRPATFDAMSVDGLIAVGWGDMESLNYPPPSGWDVSFWPFERKSYLLEADLNDLVSGTALGFGYQRDQRNSATLTVDGRLVVFPWWAVALAALMLAAHPIVRLFARLRRGQRVAARCCPECGYDLRASPNRCPECGKLIASV